MELFLNSKIKAVFLLFIAISANFLGNTLNCGIQKGLTEIPALRHLFLLMIIYFTIDFTSKSDMSPEEIFVKAIVIYIFYIILSKQTIVTFVILLLLLLSFYYLYIKINYENKQGKDVTKYNLLSQKIIYIIVFISIVGFGLYLNKQYNDHKENFDIIKFIFGNNKCTSIN